MAITETFATGERIATVGDFFALLKPRVMSLVIFTGLAGIIVAPGHIDPISAFTALLCIAVAAGASGALNMAYEGDLDARMTRTAARPVARGAIAKHEALAFGWSLSVAAVTLMGLFINLMAAALLAFTVFFYVVVYTLWLKRRTAQNIVIGGLAGALPPAIGWVAVTGHLALAPLTLVLITFLWTPPHFWALALYRCEDYVRAGLPMMPVVKGKAHTRKEILAYAIALFFAGIAPSFIGLGGPLYLGVAALFSGWMVFDAFAVLREKDQVKEPAARRLFGVSIFYLFILFAALILERLLGIAPLGAGHFGAWM